MLPEFSAVCGISQSELERVFPEQIEALAKAEGVSGERALELLKENYDGYHFCAGSEDRIYIIRSACLTRSPTDVSENIGLRRPLRHI